MVEATTVPTTGGTDTHPSFKQKMQAEWDKYGHIAIFLVIITAMNGLTWILAGNFMSRADKQGDANEKIGILEGKMEILLQEKNKQQECIIPTTIPSPTYIPTPTK